MTELFSKKENNYFCFVIIGKSSENIIWHWAAWDAAYKELGKLLNNYDNIGIRTTQSFKESDYELKFSKLNWDKKSQIKWSLYSKSNFKKSQDIDFYNTEIWVPRRSICYKQKIAPYIFIDIHNPHIFSEPKKDQYNQIILLAIREDIYYKELKIIYDIINSLAAMVDAVEILCRYSPWLSDRYSVQSTINNLVEYQGILDDLIPDIEKMYKKCNQEWFLYQPKSELPKKMDLPPIPRQHYSEIYDNVKYHFEGNYPEDLPDKQAYVHTGMYLGWLIENDLIDSDFKAANDEEINEFKNKNISCIDLYKIFGGILSSDMLSPEGNSFTHYYFDFSDGEYLIDYENSLGCNLPSLYHVEYNDFNYYVIKIIISEKYHEWKKTFAVISSVI